MRDASQVKPISCLEANAAQVLTRTAEQRELMIIGEAKTALQDVVSFMALLQHGEEGADQAANLPEPGNRMFGRVRAHRDVLQPDPPACFRWRCVIGRVRKAPCVRASPKPWAVNSWGSAYRLQSTVFGRLAIDLVSGLSPSG